MNITVTFFGPTEPGTLYSELEDLKLNPLSTLYLESDRTKQAALTRVLLSIGEHHSSNPDIHNILDEIITLGRGNTSICEKNKLYYCLVELSAS